MSGKFKKITSSFLLFIFLLPAIVKIEHHHSNFVCKAKNEKHFHVSHKVCAICSFEYSVFLANIENIDLLKEKPSDNYSNNYKYCYNSLFHFSFLLRAPPGQHI